MTTKTNKGKKKQEKKKEVFVYENKTPKGEKKGIQKKYFLILSS